MTWRIPILVGLMTLSLTSAANADPVRPRALSFSVSAGKPVGLPGQDSAMPALGVGFSYAWTRRLAFEATVTTMKSPHIVGLDQFEAGAIVYARPITRLNAWLPYVRVAAGVTSDGFTELPSFPMARVGLGAEFILPPGSSGFPGISRAHSTWGMRVEASAELFNAAAYDAGRRDGLAAFARVSLGLVHRF